MSSYFDVEPEVTGLKYILWLVIEDPELREHTQYNFTQRTYEENTNAGFDLVTAENWTAAPQTPSRLLNLGVKAMMTRKDTGETVHYWLAPRSSVYKTGCMMANSMGVIDRTYRGVLKAPVVAFAASATGFQRGDRHFQILAPDLGWIETVRIVESLPETVRGEGGFGSTGR